MKLLTNPIRLQRLAGVLLAALGAASTALPATFPEPDVVLFGHVAFDERTLTGADDVVIQARLVPMGGALVETRLGILADDLYSLRLPIDNSAPVTRPTASLVGDTLYLTVIYNGQVRAQVPYEIRSKGLVEQVDFGDVDTDNDDLPDGWEQAYLLGLQGGPDDDPDHDGLANRYEYAIGTHPRRVDAPHPADLTPRDNRITIAELSAYYKAWKKGDTWPLGPSPLDEENPIHIEYVTRASALWEAGEYYVQDITVPDGPPLWWVSVPAPGGAGLASDPPPGDTGGRRAGLHDGGDDEAPLEVESVLPEVFAALSPAVVTYRVTVRSGLRTYAVEDGPPAGWVVESMSAGGSYDATNHIVKWGPFFDRESREVSYTVVPDQVKPGQAFEGVGSYDGRRVTMSGRRTVMGGDPGVDLVQLRFTSESQQWSLSGRPGLEYAIQYSEDLVDWKPLTNGTADTLGQFIFVPLTPLAPQSFFRALHVEPGASGAQ